MRLYKKILPLLLAVVLLAGCGTQSASKDADAPMTDITLDAGLALVVDKNATDTTLQAAQCIQTYIDVKMSVGTPKIVNEDPGQKAFIFTVDESLSAGQYTFTTKDTRLFITASDPHTLLYAVKQLRLAMIEGGNSTTITADLCQQLSASVDVSNMPFTYISQNILFKNIEGGNTVNERAPRYQKLILEYQPDILALQESSTDWVFYNNKYFKTTYHAVDTTSCTILVRKDRYEVVDQGKFWLSPTPNEKSQFEGDSSPRLSMWAIVKDLLTGKEFMISNSHLDWNNDTQRGLQLEVMIEQNTQRFDQYPTIVCGDFNSSPDGPIYGRITQLFNDASKTADRNIATVDYTYHDFGDDQLFIDYILHSDDFHTNLYYILSDQYDGDVSDHYGVLAELQFVP